MNAKSDVAHIEDESSMPVWPWVVGGVIALLVFVVAAGNTPEAKAKADARAAIEFCWKEQQRKSLDPSSQRFVASACESLEQKFRDQYHVNP